MSISDSSTLSQKVINYLAKCFSYCIAQNSDVDSLKLALKCIVPHAFGEHQSCNPSWCGHWKDPLLYTHKDLPYNKDLHGTELKKALASLFDEYATDVVVKKLTPFANSQRNESLNSIIGSKNPKTKFYGGSESNDFRVACAITQKNIGYSYINKTLQALDIDPGDNCFTHNNFMDKKLEKDKKRKSNKKFKIRRHQLQSQRILKNNKKEAKEGKTYETGIGLNLHVEQENVSAVPECINLRGATHEQLKEIEKFVSPFTERPSKHYLTYEATKTYQFVFFDIETTSIGKNAEICQLSAVTENGKTYSTFIMPNGSVSPSASRVNKLTIENVNGKRTLCKNSYPVSTASLQVALKSFSTFLHQYSFEPNKNNVVTVLIGHNSSTFDVPTLLRNADASFVNPAK